MACLDDDPSDARFGTWHVNKLYLLLLSSSRCEEDAAKPPRTFPNKIWKKTLVKVSNFKPAQSPSINQLSSDDALLFIKFDSVFFFQLLFFRPPAELRLPAYGHGAGAEWRPAGRVPHGHTLAVCAASGLPGNGHTVPVDSDENGEKFFFINCGKFDF